jgi:hypothetical protein
MDSSAPNRSAHRSIRSRAALLGLAGVSALVLAPAVAQASSRPATSAHAVTAHAATPMKSTPCNAVNAGAVSAIVGWTVPAGVYDTSKIKATKANDGISATEADCTYGSETSLAALSKVVVLEVEVTSRAITTAEVQAQLKKAEAQAGSAKITYSFTPYSGLGAQAFLFKLNEDGISAEGIYAISGVHVFGASVFTTKLPLSKVASLARLSEKI